MGHNNLSAQVAFTTQASPQQCVDYMSCVNIGMKGHLLEKKPYIMTIKNITLFNINVPNIRHTCVDDNNNRKKGNEEKNITQNMRSLKYRHVPARKKATQSKRCKNVGKRVNQKCTQVGHKKKYKHF